MGCGGSKPDADGETPISLRPLRRRIEEIKRRRSGRTIEENAVSTKQLLKEGAEEEVSSLGDSIHHICQKSGLPPPPETVASNKEAVDPVKEAENPVKEAPVPIPAPVPMPEPEVTVAGEEKVTEVEEDGGISERDGSELGYGDLPGSPSFREYYYASVRDSIDISDSGVLEGPKEDDGKSEEKFRRKESIDSLTSSGEFETKPLKRGGRLRALAKGPVAVYSLLNVRSCYSNNPSSAHNDNPRLLCEKTA